MLHFFQQAIPVDRRSGPAVATPLQLTEAHEDDPILGVRLGHPLADRGFECLMRAVLQAALAPENLDEWLDRLWQPPSPEELARLLAPYRETFRIDHPEFPAMQVRPSPGRLEETGGKESKRRGKAVLDEEDAEPDGAQPISALLPDVPTGEAIRQDTDFFARRGGVKAIGSGAMLPVLYGHMVLFPPGGGGYLSLPHGTDSLKYQIVGPTLWQTLWLNVLTRGAMGGASAVWPADPADPRVFPWRDPELPHLPLGRNEDGAAKPMERARLHPAHIPMPRRYLLSPPVQGRCDLTGIEGPIFTSYRRWPKGLQYNPRGWWFPSISEVRTVGKEPDGFSPARAGGPLRLDDWLETAVLDEADVARLQPGQRWRSIPPVLRQLRTVLETRSHELTGLGGERQAGTAVSPDAAIRVRVYAQFLFGKAVGGMDQRELPVWVLEGDSAGWMRGAVSSLVAAFGEMAGALRFSAQAAARHGKREGPAAIADTLKDALLARLDGAATALPGRLATLAREHGAGEPRQAAAAALRDDLLRRALTMALALFDETFPVDGTGVTDKALLDGGRYTIPAERRRLVERLGQIRNRLN